MRGRNAVGFRHRRALLRHRQPLGQAFALVDIEHGEPLQKDQLPRLAILVTGPLGLVLRGKAIRIADRRSPLAAPHASPRRLRLSKGQPPLRDMPPLDHRRPEDQHIDPRIAPPGRGIGRHRTATRRSIPRLHPGQPPLLQLGNHPSSHLGIEARPVLVSNTHDPCSFQNTATGAGRAGGAAGANRQSCRGRQAAPAGPKQRGGVGHRPACGMSRQDYREATLPPARPRAGCTTPPRPARRPSCQRNRAAGGHPRPAKNRTLATGRAARAACARQHVRQPPPVPPARASVPRVHQQPARPGVAEGVRQLAHRTRVPLPAPADR
ncbi:hypothetical protein GGR89_003874 [Sphingomonas trueperi]|uniref:Uncharacterized protein n=1 Tax=Sphingomonas trueperi TaxID=53317 RepID=A0A7X5Y4C3_9SPHN|nr:hypothetical protein [Sphingomonas trueperi]